MLKTAKNQILTLKVSDDTKAVLYLTFHFLGCCLRKELHSSCVVWHQREQTLRRRSVSPYKEASLACMKGCFTYEDLCFYFRTSERRGQNTKSGSCLSVEIVMHCMCVPDFYYNLLSFVRNLNGFNLF